MKDLLHSGSFFIILYELLIFCRFPSVGSTVKMESVPVRQAQRQQNQAYNQQQQWQWQQWYSYWDGVHLYIIETELNLKSELDICLSQASFDSI